MTEVAIGSVFAGHRIESVAGRGGMGVVYRATHLALNRQVALKLIAPELAEDEGFRERFKHESMTAASIDHPHVIPIYHAGEEGGQLYITMRYVEGTDLRAMIAQHGKLEPHMAADLISQVASALDAAHARGLVHRDVKPANVLIAGSNGSLHAYLTDFGLTKHQASQSGLTKTGMFVGTLDYIAPEQLQGQPIDARADVYALGCVLYQTLTGNVPYPRDTEPAKIWAHMQEPPPSIVQATGNQIPDQFEDIIKRAMAKDPNDRYLSAGDLGRAAVAASEAKVLTRAERSVATGDAAPAGATAVAPPAPAPTAAAAGAEAGATRLESPATAQGAPPTGPQWAPPTPQGPPPQQPGQQQQWSPPPTPPAQQQQWGGPGGPGGAPPAPARKRGGPPVWAFIAGGVVLVGAIVGIVIAVSGGGGGGNKPNKHKGPPPITLPASITVGTHPVATTFGGGSAWIANKQDGTIERLDQRTGKTIGQPISVGGRPTSVQFAEGKIWVTSFDDKTLVKINPQSGQVEGTPAGTVGPPNHVSVGNGSAWVTSFDGPLERFSTSTLKKTGESKGKGNWQGSVLLGNDLWFVDDNNKQLIQVNITPSTFTGGKVVDLGSAPYSVASGFGSLWVNNFVDSTLYRIDPSSGNVTQKIDNVGSALGPDAVTVGLGRVWVADQNSNQVLGINPNTNTVDKKLPTGAQPVSVAIGSGRIWTTNYKAGTISILKP